MSTVNAIQSPPKATTTSAAFSPDEQTPSPDGLSAEQVRDRLARYGYNELPEKEENPFLKFLSYFWGPIPWMIEVAAILSVVVQHWADFGIILALLLMNAVVGFWEEYQAAGAIAALKARLALKARVRRGGAWSTVPARELVPGDLIRVHLGDIVPADARMLEGDPVDVDQSTLTGKLLPVTHKVGETFYSGSVIKQSEGDALVTATVKNTYFGKTAQLVEEAHTVSHFQRAVLKIGDYLIVVALILVSVILLYALFNHDPFLETLEFALILTVATVPVAMPAVLSVTMAVGSRILAKKEAIVSKLAAIEELAGMDMLCSDKTGTLTQNCLALGQHVLKTPETIMGEFGMMPPEPEDDLLAELDAKLKQIQSSAGGIEVEYQLLRGEAAAQIVAEARAIHCDLIVLGLHGHKGLGEALMGGVAAESTRTAPCAVLTVRLPQV